MDKIKQLEEKFTSEISKITKEADLFNLKADYLGKTGSLNEILKSLKDLSGEEKKEMGIKANEVKETMLALFDEKLAYLEKEQIEQKLKDAGIDLSLKAKLFENGFNQSAYHPLTIVRREVEDVFLSMGFDILDGPFIEDDYHNFEALNIPDEHPARDMQDTFWFGDFVHCLRTQTSPMQIRGMEAKKPPFKFVAPGKVFRNEALDATHEMAFHQIEAMVVGKDIGVPHMIYFLKITLSNIFKREVNVRLRTGFFPFVEPGFELDISCQLCDGKGCSVCKQSGWIEFCGCGLIHPNVLKAGNIDANEYSGFAFGMGWDRLVMMRYGIDDIRHIHSGDLRFIKQFKL